MRKLLLSIVGAVAISATVGFAAEPARDLDPKEAVRLIALKSDVRENTIEIAFIVEGTSKRQGDFEARHVRRVAAIHPVREGTSQRRQVVFYDLYWNESLGWFMWESRAERTGDAVYIWSEVKGQIVNK
jgi:hypothetical protein